uniref:Uncharacterized protein n=2 Tax=Onchocerca TaxID=6281 RepID=A0A8R1XQQ1_ONCVO
MNEKYRRIILVASGVEKHARALFNNSILIDEFGTKPGQDGRAEKVLFGKAEAAPINVINDDDDDDGDGDGDDDDGDGDGDNND